MVTETREGQRLEYRSGRFELVDSEAQTLGPEDVQVRVGYSGICGTELHLIRSLADKPGPFFFGHEFSGVIERVGRDVSSIAVGTEVACLPRLPCRMCRSCHRGRLTMCEAFVRPSTGAWATSIVVPAPFAIPIPERVSLLEAALAEPVACCLRGIDQAALPPGHDALVVGGGPIGLITALLAQRTGANHIVVSEPNTYRRELTARLGFETVDPTATPTEAIAERASGGGFDVVYEAVGSALTLELSVACAGRGSTVVVLGVAEPGEVARIRPEEIFAKELCIVGAWGVETTFGRALDLIEVLDLGRLITHTFPLEAGADAIALAMSGNAGKVALAPNGIGER